MRAYRGAVAQASKRGAWRVPRIAHRAVKLFRVDADAVVFARLLRAEGWPWCCRVLRVRVPIKQIPQIRADLLQKNLPYCLAHYSLFNVELVRWRDVGKRVTLRIHVRAQ